MKCNFVCCREVNSIFEISFDELNRFQREKTNQLKSRGEL